MSTFQQAFAAQDDVIAQRYVYDDRIVLVADLGQGRDGTVDFLEGDAIVVVDDEQYEFAVPEGEPRGSIANGVVTIEVDR